MGWNITKQTSTPASLSKHTVARGAAAQSNIMMDEDTDEEPTPELPDPVELVSPALAETLQGVTPDELAEVFNLETWSSVLSAADRERLRAHLPASETPAAQDAAARALLSREPLSLDTPPLELFVRKLGAGDLSLAGQEREQQKEVSRRKAHVLLLREHHNAYVHKLHYLRRTWSCAPPMPPLSMRPGRKGKQQQQQQQQQQHDDDGGSLVYNKEGGGLVRKRKDSDKSNVPPPQLGRPYGSGAAGAPPPLPDLSPTATGAAAKPGSAKKARAPSPSAGLERFVTGKPHASTMVRAAPAAGRGAGGGKRPKSEMAAAAAAVVAAAANQAAGGEAPQPALLSFQQGGLAPSPSKPPPLADEWPAHLAVIGATGVSDEDATPMEEDGAAGAPRGGASASPGARATASAEGSPAQVFGGGDVDKASVEAVADVLIFRLVRDAIASLPQALAPAEYVRKQVHSMADAQGMGAKLPKGSPLGQYIRSALAFLCMTAEEHAARTQRAASLPRAQQLPLVGFDEMSQSYRWLGSKEASADAMLLPLDAIHFERFCAGHPAHGGGLGTHGMRSANHGPKGGKGAGVITLPAGSAEQLAALRKQEIERYGNPDQPYKYMLRDGSVSAVAPLGKKSAGGKARDHFLLVSERPSAVTLLSLVRDAAARLPGGEGSRADVCELLKESQFVNDGVSDVQISQVVSGALDRLHQENDACVRYDSERKLWAYLHASRTVDDFLARSQQHRAALIAVAGPPKEITPPATPSAPPPQQETPESEPSPPQAAEPLPAGFSHLPMAHPGRPHG